MQYEITLKERIWDKCGGRLKSCRIAVPQLFRDYPAADANMRKCRMDVEEIVEINSTIAKLEHSGALKATYDEKKDIYKSIMLSEEQLRQMFPDRYFSEDYQNAVLNAFHGCSSKELRPFTGNDKNVKLIRKCSFRGFEQTPDDLREEVRSFLFACEMILRLTEDDFLRNISERCGLGSKFLDDKKDLILQVLRPEDVEQIREYPENEKSQIKEQLLEDLHIISAYRYALVKGEGTLSFADGSRLQLCGYRNDAIQLADGMIDKITDIECGQILSIENLTTFNAFPYDMHALVVYTGGYMNHPTEHFLSKTRTVPHYHSGDMDAFGYDILHSMEKRLKRTIIPYKMDVATYEAYKDKAVRITDANITKIKSMLNTADINIEERAILERLLADGKTLEQEALTR